MTDTPYEDVMYTDRTFLHNGRKYYFDKEHSSTYFVPIELAESKYPHLIEKEILFPFIEEEFFDNEIKDWAPGGYYDDPETYKMYLDQIPWRRQHYYFYFSEAYCDEEDVPDEEFHLDEDAIARWAGIDPADLIKEPQ